MRISVQQPERLSEAAQVRAHLEVVAKKQRRCALQLNEHQRYRLGEVFAIVVEVAHRKAYQLARWC